MDSTITNDGPQEISLLESLDGEWIKLPLDVMRDVGPAVQTLGGILKLTSRETFSAAADIASKAGLPLATVRKHLATLDAAGWINNKGRGHTPSGKPRRTATIAITKQTIDKLEPYAVLPWWACCKIRKIGKPPWSAKAVLSLLVGRLMSLKASAERSDNHGDEELIEMIENMGGDDRFQFSLGYMARQTGLSRESVIAGKRYLYAHKIIKWSGGKEENGGATTDLLVPDWDFRVIVTPTGLDKCRIDFGQTRGSRILDKG